MIKYNRHKPYNTLPPLPPEADLDTNAIFRKTIAASRALAEFNGRVTNLPNPTLFIDTIHLQEAKASSEIENILTTNEDIYRTIVSEKKAIYSSSKEVLNYKEALWHGVSQLEKRPFITTNLCISIMRHIKQNKSTIRQTPGTAITTGMGEVLYSPPEGEEVIKNKLASLEKFINEDDSYDPLIKMALMHYQFEAIHPFYDGNGRTGRILLLLYLKQSALLHIPALFCSGYIIENKFQYYQRLRAVTEKEEWENWVLFMLDMVEQSALRGLKNIERILSLKDRIEQIVKNQLPLAYSHELIEILFRLPYTKRKHLIEADLGTPKTVGNYLYKLTQIGVLTSEKVGRERIYLNHQLMDILESFY